MVTSYIPGRIRLRDPVLKDRKIAEKVVSILEKRPDIVTSVTCNPVTGSVLFLYDAQKVPYEKLSPLVPFLRRLQRTAALYDGRKRQEILAMLDELDGMAADL